MPAPRNLVNLKDVEKGFGSRTILRDVTLGVAGGERIGVVGENGGGKSTLLKLIAGVEQPDVGTLTLVLRDGSRLDVIAFTMTQGQVIYITPEGRRLSISAEIFDADATQRVNQERGTPMQLPL